MGAASDLLERERELARIDALLDAAAAGTGGVLVIAGEAGIGKTALLGAAAGRARGRDFTVLGAAGGILESDFAFGVVRRLFEPVAAPELFSDATAAAAPALGLGLRGLSGATFDLSRRAVSFELQHGLYWLTANIAERAPVLVAVDDAQWADADSLRWLVYLARRVDELPVALLVAVREGEPAAASEPLAALRAAPMVSEAVPAPLSEAAVARLVRAALGETAEPAFCHACREASGGNPFLLGALLDDLAADGVPPIAAAVDRVRGAGPAAVQRSVLLRVARLGGAAIALVQAVAILERDADLVDAAALAELNEPAARAAADALIGARVLAAAHPLRFAHPMLRAAVYADVGLARRAAGHRRAAGLLDARAPERALLHLLATHPVGDAWVLARLRAGADRALSRGSADGARVLLERALAEPPAGDERAEVLLALGEVEHGLRMSAPARLEEALGIARDPRLRARIVRTLAAVRWARGELDAGRALLEREIRQRPAHDRETQLELRADRAAFLEMGAPAPMAAELARDLGHEIDEARGDSAAERRVLASVAFHRAVWGQTTGAEAGRLAERALAEGRLMRDVGWGHPSVLAVLSTLMLVERDRELEAQLEAGMRSARARGAVTELALVQMLRARLAYFRGDLRDAEPDAREALRISDAAEIENNQHFALAILVAVLVERGELDAAEAELAARRSPDARPRADTPMLLLLQARSALRRAQGRFAEAAADALRAERPRLGPDGAPLLGRVIVALALHGSGEQEEARRAAAEVVARAQAWGVPSTLGIALRVEGVVVGGERGLALLRRAAQTLAPTPRRLEHARAVVELGAALRRANRRADAREPLAAGMDQAHRCGATALAERAREELLACGARPRRLVRTGVDALTPSELRVARLAASGLTNRQIAQALFVTRKTVETHLGGIYRKLDVNSRERLAELLAPGAKVQEPPPDAKRAAARDALAP